MNLKKIKTKEGFFLIRNFHDYGIVKDVVMPETYFNTLKIKKEDIVLDIGMNIGVFSIVAAKKGAKVIGYEPEKDNYEIAIQNIKENNVDVEAYMMGVSDVNKKAKLYIKDSRKMGWCSLTYREKFGDCKWREVECIGINEILKKNKPNKIKMDCEGEEYKIIMGVKDWGDIESMVFEYHLGARYKKIIIDKLEKHFSVIEEKEIIRCQKK